MALQTNNQGAAYPQSKPPYYDSFGKPSDRSGSSTHSSLLTPQTESAMPGPVTPSAPDEIEDPNYVYVPPTEGLQSFEGYGHIGFEPSSFPPPPPPSYEESTGLPPPQPVTFGTASFLNEVEVRDALFDHVAQHCCYGERAARDMTILDIVPSDALHYRLESFTEKRHAVRREVAYRPGSPLDGPFNGFPPPIWAIGCSPPKYFEDVVVKMPVPHTDEIRRCARCRGRGSLGCPFCSGCGSSVCSFCGGSGRVHRHDPQNNHRHHECCGSCGGSGRNMCASCFGTGRRICPNCDGHGNVKIYIELNVTYTNHKSDYVLQKTVIPDDLLTVVSGQNLFHQTLPQVLPLVSFPVKEINEQSTRLVNSHRADYMQERLHQQRQSLRAVPVTQVLYRWKSTNRTFWVYGLERKVHAPDYPQQCCCGCSIL